MARFIRPLGVANPSLFSLQGLPCYHGAALATQRCTGDASLSDLESIEGPGNSDAPCYVNIGWKHPGVMGFISVDVEFDDALSAELTDGFPFEEGAVDGVLCEDLIHRVPRPDGLNLLRSCRRIMAGDAVLRVATMDLRSVTQSYMDMADQPDVHERGRPCELLNNLFQAEATEWIYDEDELIRLARIAGLEPVGRQRRGQSTEKVCQARVDYPHCDLIMEFKLPDRSVSEDVAVSVLIPAYRASHFRDALQSALDQSWKSIEIVICDDSGGKEIEAIYEELAAHHDHVRFERNPQHLGAQGTCERLIELSNGDYIQFLSDDDVLHPDCVERLARCLQAYPWVTLAAAYRQTVDSAGEPLLRRGSNSRVVFEDSIIDGASAVNLMLETRANFIGGPTAGMFRRRDLLAAAGRPLGFHGRDGGVLFSVALWMKLLSQGDLVYLVQAMSQYRQHPEQNHRQADFDERAMVSWAELESVGKQLGFMANGISFHLKARPLATRPWWSNVVVRIYREASARVGERGLAEATESLLQLNAMLSEEPWPPIVLAEAMLSAESPEHALKVMSPTLSHHRDYFPAYALAGFALASLGKNDDAAAVFAEGCVWALPMFSSRGTAMGISEPFSLLRPHHIWIQTGRFHFAISFKLVITNVPSGTSLPIRVPVYLNGELVQECAFYGAGDSANVTAETPKSQHNAILRLGPSDAGEGEDEEGTNVRIQDLRIVLIGKGT